MEGRVQNGGNKKVGSVKKRENYARKLLVHALRQHAA
jgi:hypothetical protein